MFVSGNGSRSRGYTQSSVRTEDVGVGGGILEGKMGEIKRSSLELECQCGEKYQIEMNEAGEWKAWKQLECHRTERSILRCTNGHVLAVEENCVNGDRGR